MAGDEEAARVEAGKKPGLLRRLFGRGAAEPPEAAPQTPQAPAAALPQPGSDERAFDDESPSPSADIEPSQTSAFADREPAETPSPAAGPTPEPDDLQPAAKGWWTRLREGLARSSSSIKQGIIDVFAKRKLDAATLEDLEDILIRADLGIGLASRITAAVGSSRYEKGIEPEEVQAILAREVEAVLAKVAIPLAIAPDRRPFVILVVGVNGSGKTTTIGKLSAKLKRDGFSLMLGAGDTFRAAAIEQLRIWGERTGTPVISRPQGSDAAGLAFDAVTAAREAGTDVLMIDTAGRLQNRAELMDELGKVIRVIKKVEPHAPHAVLLVLDATVGQNALNQVEIFSRVAGVTGLVMTKLDGTARGGILVAIAEKFGLPVHFLGVGEGVDDLEPFEARDFARAIAGFDDRADAL